MPTKATRCQYILESKRRCQKSRYQMQNICFQHSKKQQILHQKQNKTKNVEIDIVSNKVQHKDFQNIIKTMKREKNKYGESFTIRFYNILTSITLTIDDDEKYLKKEDEIIYDFTWYVNDNIAFTLIIKLFQNQLLASIESIRTEDLNIPDLMIENNKYTGLSVPMLLCLHLLSYFNINKVELSDLATVPLTCNFSTTNIASRLNLLWARNLIGQKSIYSKYGFGPYISSKNIHVADISIQQMIDDCNPFIEESYVEKQRSNVKFPKQYLEDVQNATELITIFKKIQNKSMTIKEFILIQSKNRNEQNCMSARFEMLNNILPFSLKLEKAPKFLNATRHIETTMVNKDINQTLDQIQKKES